jgi:hypothetical protein
VREASSVAAEVGTGLPGAASGDMQPGCRGGTPAGGAAGTPERAANDKPQTKNCPPLAREAVERQSGRYPDAAAQ